MRESVFFESILATVRKSIQMPISDENLEEWIKAAHLKLTGEELTREIDVYVKAYDHSGMSTGRIFGKWWFTTEIPFLKRRMR